MWRGLHLIFNIPMRGNVNYLEIDELYHSPACDVRILVQVVVACGGGMVLEDDYGAELHPVKHVDVCQ